MTINENPVHDLRPFLVNAKGPAREPGTDLLAVPETAADQDGKCEMVMKLDFLCPRRYGDVREMIKRSDTAMNDKYDELMKKHRPICCIMWDFMVIVYHILVFCAPATMSEHKRGELIVGMNKLFEEMKYYTEGRE